MPSAGKPYEGFGRRMKAARTLRGLSHKAVAEAIGLTSAAVEKWEQGWGLPGTPTLMRLCAEVLLVSADWLLFDRADLPHPEQQRPA